MNKSLFIGQKLGLDVNRLERWQSNPQVKEKQVLMTMQKTEWICWNQSGKKWLQWSGRVLETRKRGCELYAQFCTPECFPYASTFAQGRVQWWDLAVVVMNSKVSELQCDLLIDLWWFMGHPT